MSEQPIPPLEDPVPPVVKPPKSRSNKGTIIAVIAIVVICCLCAGVVGGGIYGYNMLQNNPELKGSFDDVINAFGTTPTEPRVYGSDNESPTEAPAPEEPGTIEAPTQAEPGAPTEAPAPNQPGSVRGLGLSRAEMIQYLNQGGAFTFGEPYDLSGDQAVDGTHKTICLSSDCATVTLLGPADNLSVVSVAVPTDPKDIKQTTVAITLVMDVALKFTGDPNKTPTQIMSDLMAAQAGKNKLDKSFDDNGFTFTETYEPDSGIATLAIAR